MKPHKKIQGVTGMSQAPGLSHLDVGDALVLEGLEDLAGLLSICQKLLLNLLHVACTIPLSAPCHREGTPLKADDRSGTGLRKQACKCHVA